VVEVCASRDCRTIEGRQTVAMGSELRWPTMLSPGPHWWRVRREGEGRVATFVWEVFIPAEDSIVPLVGPARPDFNGDGMIGGTEFGAAWGGCHYGNPCTFAVVSDVNGDGYVDALIVQRTASPAPGMPGSSIVSNVERLRSGSSVGLVSPGVGGSGFRNIESIDAIGDINGDGYADMLLTEARYGTWSSDGIVRLLLGGAAPAVELTSSWPRDTTTMSSADFDGDGFQELVVIDNGRYSPGITVLSARCWLPDRCAIPHCGAVGLRDAPGQFINGWTDDVDRDGYPDLRVARFFWDGALTSEDWIWLGGPDGLTADRCSIGPSSRLP